MARIFSRTIFTGLVASSMHLSCGPASAAKTPEPSGPILIEVDAREAPRRILHAKLVIPAKPGPMTLYYPKWIPGEHSPSGPIANLAGLRISVGGATVVWRRDDIDMYAFHVDVPTGASSLEVNLDYLAVGGAAPFTSGEATTPELAVLSWNHILLYPGGNTSDWKAIARLKLPAGWKFSTALPVAATSAPSEVDFKPASLATLVDSPVIAGSHFRSISIDPGAPPGGAPVHRVDIVADSDAALAMSPRWTTGLKSVVVEAGALFGSRHYESYRFLLTLSDKFQGFGLEHRESSDNRVHERTLLDEPHRILTAMLLPHEFVHSWNGKYRRPAGLFAPDFQQPLKGELLWVYEGLTQYLGNTLAARSGLWSEGEYREMLALIAAAADVRPGRGWRSLADTSVAAQILYNASIEWAAWRRQTDFYDEGHLLWLEADILIRTQTQGKRSLDDFCRAFHGGASGPAEVKLFTQEDVLAALSSVAPHDWRGFWGARVNATTPRAPLAGITSGGWRLIFNDAPNDLIKATEEVFKIVDAAYSIGAWIGVDGAVNDVIPGMPAAKAGIAPGMKIIAVGGRRFTPERFRDALRASVASTEPIELLAEGGDMFRTYRLDYHGGERYPHLARDPDRPDLLSDTIRPLMPRPKPASEPAVTSPARQSPAQKPPAQPPPAK